MPYSNVAKTGLSKKELKRLAAIRAVVKCENCGATQATLRKTYKDGKKVYYCTKCYPKFVKE